MADPELEQLRKQRLAQLQSQYKVIILICYPDIEIAFLVFIFQQGDGANAQKAQEEQAKQQEDMKNSILSQIMDQSARARCMKFPKKNFTE